MEDQRNWYKGCWRCWSRLILFSWFFLKLLLFPSCGAVLSRCLYLAHPDTPWTGVEAPTQPDPVGQRGSGLVMPFWLQSHGNDGCSWGSWWFPFLIWDLRAEIPTLKYVRSCFLISFQNYVNLIFRLKSIISLFVNSYETLGRSCTVLGVEEKQKECKPLSFLLEDRLLLESETQRTEQLRVEEAVGAELSRWLSGKDVGWIPGPERSPGEGNGNPL